MTIRAGRYSTFVGAYLTIAKPPGRRCSRKGTKLEATRVRAATAFKYLPPHRDLNDPSFPTTPEPAFVPRRIRPREALLLFLLYLPDPGREGLSAAGVQDRTRLGQAFETSAAEPISVLTVIAAHLSGVFLSACLPRRGKESRAWDWFASRENAGPQ